MAEIVAVFLGIFWEKPYICHVQSKNLGFMTRNDNTLRSLSDLGSVDFGFRNDVFDMDNGTAVIRRGNLGKYLEKYSCKDEEDLSDTLWYNYGMFVRIVE